MARLAPPLQQVGRTFVRVGRRKLIYFGGCDYFRLSSHRGVQSALRAALDRYGWNVAASRLTTGNHVLYEQLETRLARFFKADSAVLVSSGYLGNMVVAQALSGRFSHVLIDERAHASLQDAAEGFKCRILKFRHRSVTDLELHTRRLPQRARPILLTDGMFSHDGSVAPLAQYLRVLPPRGMLLVDDAHAAGVMGKRGRGSLEQEAVHRAQIIQTITLSKALGVYGGAILCSRSILSKIVSRSRMFGGSTPIPLPLAAAVLAVLRLLDSDKSLRRRLDRNAQYVKKGLSGRVPETPGPVVAVVPKNRGESDALKQRLLANGIHPPLIQYPGGPVSAYFRFAISSEHTQEQLDVLIEALNPGNSTRR